MTDPASSTLRGLLRGLRDRTHADVAALAALRAVAARRREIDDLLADLDRQLERVDTAVVMTLVGATGAGKSTLLNALAGRTIAAEGIDRPTTRRPTIYAPPEADLGALLDAVAAAAPEARSDGATHIVRHRSPGPWAGHVLIDAPDLNSIDRAHRNVVAALCDHSDILIVVLHHQSVVEAASVSFLDTFADRRRLVFVLNRSDELTPEARDALLQQARTLAADRFAAPDAPVVAVSARAASGTGQTPEWLALRAVLERLTREPAVLAARRLNALGCAERLARVFDAVRGTVSPELEALREDTTNGLARLALRVGEDVANRINLRRPDLTAVLCFETARRWEGPGGWALRTGGPATLGLGAAGLLLRRHPLSAAAAALGTLAADRIGSARRAARVTDATSLVPTAQDLGAWYADALAAARLRAGRLTGNPEAFELPSLAVIHAGVADTVDAAWTRITDVDVPAAAARGALRILRWPLDLPVYAFLAWMLYRVGVSFVAGTYAGIDFLVNAALLLGAYLLAIRTGVRTALARRARRLAGQLAGRARAVLDDDAAGAAAGTRAQVDSMQATLDRLCALADIWRRELGAP